MKTGAGDDPFADDANDETSESGGQPDQSEPETAGPASGQANAETQATSESTRSTERNESRDAADDSEPDIPWVLRRSSVKDDRPNITQFFLRDETDRGERRFRNEVEAILDTDVYTLDLREAAYLVAMEHPDEVAALLTEWGYEYLD